MNIFPFVGVRYIMYYHGKHGGWLATLWIQWNVIQAELVEFVHASSWANFAVTCAIFHHIQKPLRYTRRGTAMWTISHGENCTLGWEAWIQHAKNTFNSPSRTLFKKTYSYSVSSSTITCLSIANQSRAANPNRQSSKVASKNTSLALSQLQPIREGTYVAKLHRAPRGYANVQDLPHDLPSFFFYHANHVGVISRVWKGTGILAHCVRVNASLLLDGLSNAFLIANTLTLVMPKD